MKTTERRTSPTRTSHKFMWCMGLLLTFSLGLTAYEVGDVEERFVSGTYEGEFIATPGEGF